MIEGERLGGIVRSSGRYEGRDVVRTFGCYKRREVTKVLSVLTKRNDRKGV